ncbi:MAG: FG-GAP-like repeat-containing protein [Tannerella sp.]|jgi:uncharacterized repeat protein (TIGR02543 family)/uncharacterized repeat protein (TIGR01451 family)|nr:FG-GAP-like repeat-containing protein [Tannerella sp.]
MKGKITKILLFILILGLSTNETYSRERITEGKEFHIVFTQNPDIMDEKKSVCMIRYVVPEACYITLQYNNGLYGAQNKLYHPGIYTETVNYDYCVVPESYPYTTSYSGIKVTSTKNISMFAMNQRPRSADGTTILPVEALGNHYTIISQRPYSTMSSVPPWARILIIALEDETVLSIKEPNGNVAFNGSLSSGQTCAYAKAADLTGYTIESNHNIAVFSAVDCGDPVPLPIVAANTRLSGHNFEQMWPTYTAGKNFFLWNHSNHSTVYGDWINILALEDNTTVTKKEGNTTTTISLNKHKIHSFLLQEVNPYRNESTVPVMLNANKPIIVNHLLGTSTRIKWWPSVEQNITRTIISPFNAPTFGDFHRLNIMTPANSTDNMIVREYRNGVTTNVKLKFYTNKTNPDYVIATKDYKIPDDNDVLIKIINPAGFMANMQSSTGLIISSSVFDLYASFFLTAGESAFDFQSYYTIQTKTRPLNDTHYAATSEGTHTFEVTDNIIVKRTIENPFNSVKWFINDVQYTISENGNIDNTLTFPASALTGGENKLSMSVRYNGASVDSVYSGNLWLHAIEAEKDSVSIMQNTDTLIDVTSNDMSLCAFNDLNLTITQAPSNGSASVENGKIKYTPATDFTGYDSIKYSIVCYGIVSNAKVNILVYNKPDNISDADCYTKSPVGVWSFKELYKSVEGVFEMSVPLVGDIDNDGNIEIVCAGTSIAIDNFSADTIKIFDAAGKRLKNKFPVERFHAGYGTIAMADVDKDGFAEFFVATTENATAGNRGYIYCYRHDGTFKWKSSAVYTTNVASYSYPYLTITDFNEDGIPEIMGNDRIFNALNGNLLLDCRLIQNSWDYGTGGGHTSYYGTAQSSKGAFSSVADMDNDGKPELIAGRNIYKIQINSLTTTSLNSCTKLRSVNSTRSDLGDGYTTIADLNLDGYPDVVVVRYSSEKVYMYAWDGRTGALLNSNVISVSSGTDGGSIPVLGDLDGDGVPEIAFSTQYKLNAFKYNKSSGTISEMSWSPLTTSDVSGSTALTLFDFNQDKKMELVYRDTKTLRIIDGTTGATKSSVACASWTMNEYPVVADVDGDGYANIVVLGKPVEDSHGNGFLYVFDSDLAVAGAAPWAPARKVWNQWGYNAVNINEDLTIPPYRLNPATVFPDGDGLLGTTDDVRPYNGFLMQQTKLNKNGAPVWPMPDIYPAPSLINSSIIGDMFSITVGIVNQGDASIGSPVYVTLYKESIATANKIITDNANIHIMPGDTGYVTVRTANITPYLPMVNIIVRVNDNGTTFTYLPECNDANNEITILNPVISLMTLMMKKEAALEGIPHNGTYDNPISALFSETIEYTITAINVNTGAGNVIIRDTLPPYLNFVSSNPAVVPATAGSAPQRDALEWTMTGVASMAATAVTVKATPQAGSSSSQPLFINRAWVTVSDTITLPTNSTYHQGASVGVATFSAGFGGNIYNAAEQALDYRTTPRAGIVIVPDEGYRFAGWSHGDYISLRGRTIEAEEGIMYYDTLTVYGNVELQANFEPEEYPIEYHLNGSVNAENNPPTYTIESGSITLGSPEKAGDVFTGWTGSNGDKPQMEVTIPKGSSGKLEFYANFLRSGREDEAPLHPENDRIWAAKDELFIRTLKTGSVVRIYSTEGILQKRQTIRQAGETKMKLRRGIYVVTLDNGIGQIVRIE